MVLLPDKNGNASFTDINLKLIFYYYQLWKMRFSDKNTFVY